jgi:hypothetical protein
MKRMLDKSKLYNIHDKALTPLKPRQIIRSPSNQAIWVANIKF